MDSLGELDHFIKEIDQAKDTESVCVSLRKQVGRLGFDRFSYQLLVPPNGPLKQRFYISAYPEEWTKRYVEKSYISHDLISRHAARSVRPFPWLEIGRFNDFTPDQKLVFNEGAEFGMKNGGTVPIHGPGNAKAQFTVAVGLPEIEFTKLFEHSRHEIHLTATYAHERLVQLGLYEHVHSNLKLTPRETEALTWSARGKTASEISDILSISDDTVSDHIKSACRKLDTSNKTHAVAVAVLHRIIIP